MIFTLRGVLHDDVVLDESMGLYVRTKPRASSCSQAVGFLVCRPRQNHQVASRTGAKETNEVVGLRSHQVYSLGVASLRSRG